MKKIAVLTGGYSGEYAFSLKSVEAVISHLDRAQFEPYIIEITQENWYYRDATPSLYSIDKSDFSLSLPSGKILFDAALMMVHGAPGANGRLQGYFEMLGIPYTGSDATTSALLFNKRYTVALAAFSGICVAKSVLLFRHQNKAIYLSNLLESLTLPLFVKPNNGGASIGVSKVNQTDKLLAALDKAFQEDDQVLVEECIEGREFSIGAFRHKGEIIALPITEVRTSHAFLDSVAKSQGLFETIIPASIETYQAQILSEQIRNLYQVFNCKGVIRADFILNKVDNKPYMLEVNSVPTQTDNSSIPKALRLAGWTMTDFYTAMIMDCLADKSSNPQMAQDIH